MHGNKFLNPVTDGVVLPILHLNGYKISNPTLLSRIPEEELRKMLEGCGWKPYFVEGDEPMKVHRALADTLDTVTEEILAIRKHARETGDTTRPIYPMIVLRTPKLDRPENSGRQADRGQLRAHQVPLMMDSRSTCPCSSSGCAATIRRSCSTKTAS